MKSLQNDTLTKARRKRMPSSVLAKVHSRLLILMQTSCCSASPSGCKRAKKQAVMELSRPMRAQHRSQHHR